MPRRQIYRKSTTEVELFPFLSVLACTIGTLILLIIVLTTQALEPQEAVVVAKVDENSRGANRDKTPVYIECREDGFVLHPSTEFAPRADLYDQESPLGEILTSLKQNKSEQYLIVIVRPDGLEMFNLIRNIVQESGIDLGYEPLEYGLELKIAS
ncbi:MAG: hypothetical protein AAFQ80_17080 [Cyanobacteria bacterium J06621_8]